MEFDDLRTTSLDGLWDFYPGDHDLADLDRLAPEPIEVPGLWEAQGHLDLDGAAWYRRRFVLDDVTGGWTLRFGAVMDMADVFLNGVHATRHEEAFTPFEVDAAPGLRAGENELAVRVFDPSLRDADHLRMAHGKQGWANHVFPSRPSLYMTYGGIWQSVTLRRHGSLVIADVFVNSDPDGLIIDVEIENRGSQREGEVAVRSVGRAERRRTAVPPGGRATIRVELGPTNAARWRPDRPNLHDAVVDVWGEDGLSDSRTVRYGLRAVRLDGHGLTIDGEPYRIKAVLVQGFRDDCLYAEGSDDQIRAEVTAARSMGFNTLRLHIKAFHPAYLDACDEMGMLLYCDLPVAEPLAHEEMGSDTLLTRRCLAAAREQVRRDRNHPSVVLWSAMNEICDLRREARSWPEYESFARQLFDAVREEDPTRPIIENDWVDPDPDEVFQSPILTAHWYGRLHRDYLDHLDTVTARWADAGRVMLVTEFGDWGLPQMPLVPEPPFWDTRAIYAAGLAETLWPASVGRFVLETQRYQGVSDRLQTEVFRRHDGIAGYCLTELTDVPVELNGLLDLHRNPKPLAVAEVIRANQVVLPMLHLGGLATGAGELLCAPLYVANDGPALDDVTVEIRFGDSAAAVGLDALLTVDARTVPLPQVVDRFYESTYETRLGRLAAHTVTAGGDVEITAPEVTGSHDLVLRLRSHGRLVSENRYPVHVIRPRPAPVTVRLLGSGREAAGLAAVGAVVGDEGITVVAEGALRSDVGAEVARRLDDGEVVVVLAQEPAAQEHYPVPVVLDPVATAWGSTVFGFTTDHGALPSLPRRALLVAEDSTIQARCMVAAIAERPFPDTPVVIAYKPVPGAVTGTVVGAHSVGRGRLVLCQYRLSDGAADGDTAARALLAEVLLWATEARPTIDKELITKDDGRRLISYTWHQKTAW